MVGRESGSSRGMSVEGVYGVHRRRESYEI